MAYAIVTIGGKQYRVQEGEKLLVDRLAVESGKTFSPQVLLVGGDGDTRLTPSGVTVTAKVLGDVKGPKIRIGKYRKRTGYKKHTGFRASLSQIEIESIGGKTAAKKAQPKAEPKTEAKAAPKAETTAAAPADDHVKGMPKGYEDMKVTEIAEAAPGWRRPMLEAALEYEQAHGARKGAIAALESALAAKEDH
jgi:large subunit ribosomal protein L21